MEKSTNFIICFKINKKVLLYRQLANSAAITIKDILHAKNDAFH